MVFLAEHSWTISFALVAALLLCTFIGLHRGSVRWLAAAGACLIGFGVTVMCGWLIVTPADHARGVIEQLVAAAVAGDPAAAKSCFSPSASIHMGSAEQPGSDRAHIDRAFDSFATRHRIETNEIASLTAQSTADDRATVDLSCRTRTASSYGTVPTRWQFEVARESDGIWRITRITWRAVGNQKPNLSLL